MTTITAIKQNIKSFSSNSKTMAGIKKFSGEVYTSTISYASQNAGKSKIIARLKKLPVEVCAIPVLSASQLYDDYQSAEEGDKTKVLTKELIILGATCLGAFGLNSVANKALKNNLSALKKEVIKFASLPIGGIISGVIAGGLADFIIPTHNFYFKKSAKAIVLENLEEKASEKQLDSKLKKIFKYTLPIAATCAGVFGGHKLSQKAISFFKLDGISNIIKVPSIIALGFISNVATKSIIKKVSPDKNIDKDMSKNYEDVLASYELMSHASSEVFGNTFSALKGFSAGTENGFGNKVKSGFFEIISGIVIPGAIILPAAKVLDNKMKEGKVSFKIFERFSANPEMQKTIARKSVIVPITILSIYLGNLAGKWFNNRVTEKLVKKEMWQHIKEKRSNVLTKWFNGIRHKNKTVESKKVEATSKVKETKKISKIETENKIEKKENVQKQKAED